MHPDAIPRNTHPGNARIIDGAVGNAGSTQVQFGGEGGTPVSTIDLEAQSAGAGEISLIKIDVEGAELEVLAGGVTVIARQRPVLCIEVHTTEHLRQVLRLLDHELILLTYLNKDWEPAYQGALELWDIDTRQCVQSVLPTFGHTILIKHGGRSLHGHPQPAHAAPRPHPPIGGRLVLHQPAPE